MGEVREEERGGPGPRVSVVIPAYREEARLAATLAALRRAVAADEVVVVDDGSPDATGTVAERLGATVVRHPTRLGKAAALASGVAATRGEVVLFLDADLGGSAAFARELLEPVLLGRCDVAIARPLRRSRGGFGMVRRLASWVVARLGGATLAAPLSGQRAMRRAFLPPPAAFGRGWEVEVRLLVLALWKGARVLEVPVDLRHRETGRLRGALHRMGQGVAVLRAFLALRREAVRWSSSAWPSP